MRQVRVSVQVLCEEVQALIPSMTRSLSWVGHPATAAGATYIYDAEGIRVEKQGSAVMDTVYFGGAPIARYSGGQWTDLIYGPNGLLAEVPGTQNGVPLYRATDYQGTIVGSLLANGTFVDPVDHTPFGQVFSGNTSDPYLFTGKERDTESGNDYFGARYYASSMGRFMSPDWSAKAEPVPYAKLDNPQSLNLYAYVNNNPLRAADLDGHDDYDGKVHVTPNADGTKTAVQGTQTTATSQTKDASGNVTSTTTTTTKSLTTVTLDAHGDVSGANSTTTVSSQTVDSKGSVTGSTSSTSTSSLDEHSSQVGNIQNDAKGLLQMNVTDLVPKTFAPKILDHFHITGQDIIDGVKAFGQGARDASALCSQGVWCNH